jgi:hypothetical protein
MYRHAHRAVKKPEANNSTAADVPARSFIARLKNQRQTILQQLMYRHAHRAVKKTEANNYTAADVLARSSMHSLSHSLCDTWGQRTYSDYLNYFTKTKIHNGE